MMTTCLLFYTSFMKTLSRTFISLTPENAVVLSRGLGPWSSSLFSITYQLCDLEYVTHPLWAVYVILQDLSVLLFWDFMSVSFTDQSLNYKGPIQKCHFKFTLVSRCLPTDPLPQMPQAIWDLYF